MSELKQQILERITAFQKGSLRGNALALLKSLGYASEKTLDLGGSPEAFLEQFDSSGQLAARKKALSEHWKSVHFLFQLTDEEINGAQTKQESLFKSDDSVDGSIIKSYLFFAVELKDRQKGYTRSDLSDLTREINRLFGASAILLVKYGTQLSLCIIDRRQNKKDGAKDVLEKVTQIKDISLIETHPAHIRILEELALSSLLKEEAIRTFVALQKAWRKALSTRELNERFYKELSAWYYWASSEIKLPIMANYLQGRKKADEENVKNFTIRLICRTIFCWFLKERKLIDRSLLELFDAADNSRILTCKPDNFSEANTYYRGILQNIFFNCLNEPMDWPKGRRKTSKEAEYDKTVKDPDLKKLAYRGKQFLPPDFDYGLFDRIPYLNGGLFDKLKEDNASDVIEDDTIRIPNKLFYAKEEEGYTIASGKKTIKVEGLNRLLARYKFTIAENTPLDEEVALDPELLGLVFENLLAEVDPDEDVAKTARKASGSFYTPRKVIDYMVNESLRLHLENRVQEQGGSAAQLKAVTELVYFNRFDENDKKLADWIVEALDKIKVLDPACGSGAFPMGMLQRIVALLKIVDPGNKRWLHFQLERIPDITLRKRAEADLLRHADDYMRKLGIVRNAIYGVDIQPLAALISKLRFFISIMIDQRIDLAKPESNYGITPLPNVETKIICADSLRNLNPELFEQKKIDEIRAAREEYYLPETPHNRREELADCIVNDMAELYPHFAELVTGKKESNRELLKQRNVELLKEWFRHSTIPAPFFNFEIFFPELLRSGFDIVIGNPPYGGNSIDESVQKDLNLGSKDPYGAFIARYIGTPEDAHPILKPGGVLSYIVSDTFMTIKSHKLLRQRIMRHRMHKMIRVHPDTFKATVNTAVIVLQRNGQDQSVPQEHPLLMADLTQVNIHDNYERFLELLYRTTEPGEHQKAEPGSHVMQGDDWRSESTAEYAIYHYPQALIRANSNWPFFVASPKLFALMQDTKIDGHPLKTGYCEIGGKQIQTRKISINGETIELTKLDQIAEVKQGLATGDNDAYLFQKPEARGTYRDINQFKQFLLTDADLDKISANEKLHLDVIENGISKDDKKSFRYFAGRYIIPYDKGGESDSDEGWLPKYHVPTDYFIDWSEESVYLMKTKVSAKQGGKIASRFQNKQCYFIQGLTWSDAGFYSPTLRFSGKGVFDVKGSRMLLNKEHLELTLGFLNSNFAKMCIKALNNHTVSTQVDDFREFSVPVFASQKAGLLQLIAMIVVGQKTDPRYDYASNEQIEIDRLVYEAYGLNKEDIQEVENWYARRYPKLAAAQRRNRKELNK